MESLCDHMPLNINRNAIYGPPVGLRIPNSVRPLCHQLDSIDVALVEKVSQSRMTAAYEETQRIVREEPYARMNERMQADKEAQLVDIWI